MTRRAALSLLAVAVVLAGCGASRLSHEELVKRGDAVCSRYKRQVRNVPPPASVRQVQRYVARVLPPYRRALDELRALKPPKADDAGTAAWLQMDERVAADLERLRAAARRGAYGDVRHAIAAAAADDRRASRLAARVGFNVCGG